MARVADDPMPDDMWQEQWKCKSVVVVLRLTDPECAGREHEAVSIRRTR